MKIRLKSFRKLFMAFGYLGVVFCIIMMSLVWWWALSNGGNITVGDIPEMLMFELFIIVPCSLFFMAALIFGRKWKL